MATIKSYTDIEQSKKLTEILPLESADMTLLHKEPYETSDSKFDGLHEVLCIQFIKYDKPTYRKKYRNISYFPCWSLAALLSLIPQELFDGEYIINITEGCDNKWIITYDHYKNRNHSYYGLSTGADNPVDACYEIILKLNELNLL